MARDTTHNADQVIQAIKGTGGIKARIAENLGVSRWTVNNYIDRWVTVKNAFDEETAIVTDNAITKLIELMENGDFQAIKFYLSTKGKERGFTEKREIEHQNIPIIVEKTIRNSLEKAYGGEHWENVTNPNPFTSN